MADTLAPGPTSPAAETILAAGDVFFDELFLTTVNGKEIDIKNFCMQLTLHEDLFSNVMTGSMIVVDALNLFITAPLVGGEFLSIQLRTPGFPTSPESVIRKTFTIYAVTDRRLDKDRQQFYTLHFISVEGMQDNVISLSKSFSGQTDTLVNTIFESYLNTPRWMKGGTFSESTPLITSGGPHSTNLHFVAPYWTPLKIINWIAARSLGKQNKGSNFLFFESNKAFYFASIEDLIEEQRNSGIILGQYFYGQSNIRTEATGFSYRRPDIDRQFQIVERQTFPEYFDLLKMHDSGYLASTLYTHDILLKQYKEWIWDYAANFDTFQHLESFKVAGNKILSTQNHKFPFYSGVARDSNTHRTLRTKQYRLFDDVTDPNYQNWVVQRNSLLNEAGNLRLELDVAGRTDAEVGQLIYYHFPNSTNKELHDQQPFDPILSGLYMITAIRHTFTPGKHKMRFEVMKDSYQNSVG